MFGSIDFASLYDFSMGYWNYSNSVAVCFSFLLQWSFYLKYRGLGDLYNVSTHCRDTKHVFWWRKVDVISIGVVRLKYRKPGCGPLWVPCVVVYVLQLLWAMWYLLDIVIISPLLWLCWLILLLWSTIYWCAIRGEFIVIYVWK